MITKHKVYPVLLDEVVDDVARFVIIDARYTTSTSLDYIIQRKQLHWRVPYGTGKFICHRSSIINPSNFAVGRYESIEYIKNKFSLLKNVEIQEPTNDLFSLLYT